VRYFANRSGVTVFTTASVAWADSMTATRSCSSFSYSRAMRASGIVLSSFATMRRARALFASFGSRGMLSH